jgi:hypothetical protein
MEDKLIVGLSADIKDLKTKLNEANGLLSGFGKKAGDSAGKASDSFSSLGSVASKLGGILAGAFAVNSLSDFGSKIVQTTAEFQKFEAVLSNTLGSSSAAQMAMKQINDFASTTPFAVDELTSSFVKLANQGFRPTMNEMRSLGDLAASTGKSFNQLAEAILDAQTGEFERLKEFGIKARVEGDKVMFTFKGVKTQIDNTSDSIKNYILSLGNAEGVTGAMAKISQTLGGQLSNLGDSFTQLQNNIGQLNSGALFSMVTLLQKAVGYFTELTGKKLVEQKLAISILINGEESAKIIQDYNKELAKIGEIKDVNKLNSQLEYINTNLQFYQQAMLNETNAKQQDIYFAYWNLFKEARKAANAQQKLILKDQELLNNKLAEQAAKDAKKQKFKETIKFKPSIDAQLATADIDLTALQEAKKPISDFQAQTNMLNGSLKELGVIGGDAFKAIQIPINGLKEKAIEINETMTALTSTIAVGLTGAFESAMLGTESFGQAFGKMIKQLIARLLAAVAAAVALAAIITIATGGANLATSLGKLGIKGGFAGLLNLTSGGMLGGSAGSRVVSTVGTGTNQGNVSFEIRGDKLYGVLQNYQSRLDRLQ